MAAQLCPQILQYLFQPTPWFTRFALQPNSSFSWGTAYFPGLPVQFGSYNLYSHLSYCSKRDNTPTYKTTVTVNFVYMSTHPIQITLRMLFEWQRGGNKDSCTTHLCKLTLFVITEFKSMKKDSEVFYENFSQPFPFHADFFQLFSWDQERLFVTVT